ncbi:hypothetical protein AAFN88_03155 [Pelagibius sp. CAU 1746]|uniref:hypothetical protein n=1 Tax=Pelagibius sp. CAU 1746 TaxID=3140370 RepID=UPI00325AA5BF
MVKPLARANLLKGALAVALLLGAAACGAPAMLDRTSHFDAASDKAIVLLGGGIVWAEDFRDPDRSLTLHWQEFDPETLRLVPGGKGFASLIRDSVRLHRGDPYPPARVQQIDPGTYALVAAGTGQFKTLYVAQQQRYRNKWGLTWDKDSYIDPLEYIDPQAKLVYGQNSLFSVQAGQIVYLGHFEFFRGSKYLGSLAGPRRFEDIAAARAALAAYPGISGPMIVADPAKQPQFPQSTSR